jgi:hypothetical protein
MHIHIKNLSLAAGLCAMSACGATTTQEVANALQFGVGTEVLRQNTAVAEQYLTPVPSSDPYSTVQSAGAATYTGQIALYADRDALDAPMLTALPTPDILGDMALSVSLGTSRIILTGEGAGFVTSSGEALTGTLSLTGEVAAFMPVPLVRLARPTGDLTGSLTDGNGTTLPYNVGVSGQTADAGRYIQMSGSTGGGMNGGNAFATMIGGERN